MKVRFNTNTFRDYCIFFLLVTPPIIEYIHVPNLFHAILNACKITLIIACLVRMAMRQCSRIEVLSLIYVMIVVATTIIHLGSYRQLAQFIVCVFASNYIGEEVLQDEKSFNRFIKYAFIIVVLNLLSEVFYRNGLVQYHKENTYKIAKIWFLGSSNTMTIFLLGFISFFIISIHRGNEKKLSIIGIIVSLICALIGDSATGKVTVLIVVLFYFFYRMNILARFKAFFNIRFFIGIIVVFFFALVVFNSTGVFGEFIIKQLGKDITLTGRTSIWRLAIAAIIKKPIIGWGIQPSEVLYGVITASHCHDYYLNILFESGLLGFGLWFGYILCFAKEVIKKKIEISILLGICMFSFLLAQISEVYNYRYLCVFYLFIGYGYQLSSKTSEQNEIHSTNYKSKLSERR